MLDRWIIGGVLTVAGLYGLRVAWSEWRGAPPPGLYRAPDWWPFDMPSWRALIRSGPIGAVEGPLVGVGYVASGFEDSHALRAVEIALVVLATLTLLLTITVALVNRPALVVARPLRTFPGAIGEWRGEPVPPPPEPAGDGPATEPPS